MDTLWMMWRKIYVGEEKLHYSNYKTMQVMRSRIHLADIGIL